MSLSRRNLLRNLGVGAVVGAAAPALRGFPLAPDMEAALWGNSVPAVGPNADHAEPVLLYRNENPYGASEKVVAVLRESASSGNRYPRTEYDTLLDKLAALHKVKREQIVLGCGSGEILCMAAMAFLGPGKKLIFPAPTFPALGKLAKDSGTQVVEVPLGKNYGHDLTAMLAHCDESTNLVYICNPNNPTGTITPRKDIELFISRLTSRTFVLIDEAYHHFPSPGSGYESFLDNPFPNPHIIVARTFSKIYGLAGMRIGYAVAAPEVAKRLAAGFPGWSVSVVSARAASAALDDVEYARANWRVIRAERERLSVELERRGFAVIPSQANFLLVTTPDRAHAGWLYSALKMRGVLVRFFDKPALDNKLRISVGAPDENDRLLAALDASLDRDPFRKRPHTSGDL